MKTVSLTKKFYISIANIIILAAAVLALIFFVFRDESASASKHFVFTALILLVTVLLEYGEFIKNDAFWRIRYDETTLVFRNAFGRQTTLRFSEIMKIERTYYKLYLFSANKRFEVYLDAFGAQEFLQELSKHAAVPAETGETI